MQRQTPIVRCFVALCFSAAATLAAFEWRNPFPQQAIVSEDLPAIGRGQAVLAGDRPLPFPGSSTGSSTRWRVWSGGRSPAGDTARSQTLSEPVHLVLSLSARHLEVQRPGKPTLRYEVAVGQADWQTPTGEFEVINKLENPTWQHPITREEIPPGPDNPLGSHWIGFWTDGRAQIGFHGTHQEELIGKAVSHGCVRMRNRDIRNLYPRVGIGTTITVVP